ncbi:hydrolase, partial [Streptomyces hundungensis]
MSDTPFGFGLPPEEPDNGDGKKKDPAGGGQGAGGQGPNPFGFPGAGGGDNPFAAMFGSMNPNDLGAAFQQLGQMLSYEGGPVNWDMAKQIARQTVAQGTADGTKDAS